MYKNDFNGFATEEQYEAVKDIIVDEIDDYTDTIMVICHTLQNGEKNVEVDVDTKSGHSLRYHMDKNGVFYVNTEGENFPIQECKILVALDDCSREIFGIINTYDSQVRLKQFLGGDDSSLYEFTETIKGKAISARDTLDNTIKADVCKIEKDTIRDIGFGVCLWRDEDIFPILEEHYGITVTNRGNKYIYFKHAS